MKCLKANKKILKSMVWGVFLEKACINNDSVIFLFLIVLQKLSNTIKVCPLITLFLKPEFNKKQSVCVDMKRVF